MNIWQEFNNPTNLTNERDTPIEKSKKFPFGKISDKTILVFLPKSW